ncbi:glycosyltransferase family 61 protein [bacterium]|nr:MAG: glycosyltransferase family 61 protein [bacterium]
MSRIPSVIRHTARALRASAQFLAHQLPGDSRLRGAPRGGVMTCREWWEKSGPQHGVVWQEMFPTAPAKLREPLHLEPELPAKFRERQEFVLDETFVLNLPKGRSLGKNAAIITPDDTMLIDVSLEIDQTITHDPWKPSLLTQIAYPRLQQTDETVGVIASYWGEGYFHWFFDALPRLELLQRSGIEIDKYIVNAEFEFQRESLRMLGIPEEKWIVAQPGHHLEARQLVMPSLPARMGYLPRRSSEFLRSLMLPKEAPQQRKRIYISRQKAARRKLLNPQEIEPLLESYGFEAAFLEEMGVEEKAELFAGAEAVVALHGAGLSHLVFCPPEIPVIEMFSPHYFQPCYWNLASDNDLRYGFLLGEDIGGGGGPNDHPDIKIDPAKLETALENWVGRPH